MEAVTWVQVVSDLMIQEQCTRMTEFQLKRKARQEKTVFVNSNISTQVADDLILPLEVPLWRSI